MIGLVAVRTINVISTMRRTALGSETHIVAALDFTDSECAFDAVPTEADPVVQVRAFYPVRQGLILGGRILAHVESTRVIIKGDIPRIHKFDIAP
jgi:hypothetical protein